MSAVNATLDKNTKSSPIDSQSVKKEQPSATPAAPLLLDIKNVQKHYGKFQALKGVSLDLREGEIISVLGPSGCGKSTLLQLVAGLAKPDGGEIVLSGQRIASASSMVPPEKRGVNMVFQDYALWPHMSVFDNIAYGLKQKKMNRGAIRDKVGEAVDLLRLNGLEDRLPPQLSGGQQQRVAIARAIVTEPRLMLLDEPLSNLDMRLRIEMRTEMAVLFRRLGISVFHVTHDPEEAFAMADRLLIMREGEVDQFATPEQCFSRPASREAASLLGAINRLEGEFAYTPGGELALRTPAGLVPGIYCGAGEAPQAGERGELRFRPEELKTQSESVEGGTLHFRIVHGTFEGTRWRSLAETTSGDRAYLLHSAPVIPGEEVTLILPRHAALFYRV
ncbi:ABC transporter ATP-binding protein [Saccharibacillus sp. JS10]|uniref:ABC transporter ATP-binding protein n=1 Tax=Saccharibacillus sp. JS10 TaxID=2950552 RepID=UPI002108CF54|nr:ABC transporter ATP-binding protein [Saccharibacillus sp. JS10]MCQ4087309.1 ABC transporter ATP-binding protein [Saccharibacillus sp. JS10]